MTKKQSSHELKAERGRQRGGGRRGRVGGGRDKQTDNY